MAVERLYTEACVRAMSRGGELVLGPGELATPAALDEAHRRGVRVVRAGERRAAGGGGARRDCLWHRVLETDGTYVVEVRGGRAVVTRLGAGGPQAFGEDRREDHGR